MLTAIYDALAKHPAADGVRVSIEAAAIERTTDEGEVYTRKCLCWNLTARGEYVNAPVLALVHAEVTEEILRRDLAHHFAGLTLIVDNDIETDG